MKLLKVKNETRFLKSDNVKLDNVKRKSEINQKPLRELCYRRDKTLKKTSIKREKYEQNEKVLTPKKGRWVPLQRKYSNNFSLSRK